MPPKLTAIIRDALLAVNGENLVSERVRIDDESLIINDILANETVVKLSDFSKIIVAGAGKASGKMAAGIEKLLGARISGGLVIVPSGSAEEFSCMETAEAGHPFPDGAGRAASKKLMEIADSADKDTLIIFLLSGGASSLFSVTPPEITPEDERRLTSYMMESGADIRELNAVRKTYSLNKGGRFSAAAYPATVISIAISDVTGNDLSVIGSAPSYRTADDYNFLLYTIRKYNLLAKTPDPILPYLTSYISESHYYAKFTPTRHQNVIIGDNSTLTAALEKGLQHAGYEVIKILTPVTGDTDSAVSLLEFQYKGLLSQNQKRPLAVLSGGETTTVVAGNGTGGRNQELALKFLLKNSIEGRWQFYSIGSDGIDGNSSAAGGMVTSEMLSQPGMRQLAETALGNSDSNTFLKTAGGEIITGPTGTNVMDIQILAAE